MKYEQQKPLDDNRPSAQKPPEASVANPRRVTRESRIPMSTAVRKMEVKALDGFYMHCSFWILTHR